MSQIFVSYASADRERVERLVHALEADGLEVWWDRDIASGQSFHKVIEQALTAASCVIVAWTRQSIASEWVLNEASDARKRDRLVPVLLDAVTPPLEFRHLQAADLSSWQGDTGDSRFIGLRSAWRRCWVGEAPLPAARHLHTAQRWLHTRAGQALGIAGLLVGASILLLTQASRLDSYSAQPQPTRGAREPVAAGPNPRPSPSGRRKLLRRAKPVVAAASLGEPLNLLDTDGGARLLAASEESWKHLFSGKLTYVIVSRSGFAVLAVRGNRPAKLDTLGVFVDSASTDNIKTWPFSPARVAGGSVRQGRPAHHTQLSQHGETVSRAPLREDRSAVRQAAGGFSQDRLRPEWKLR